MTPTQPATRGQHRPADAQSLGGGAAGIALLHIERAAAGLSGWNAAHTWLTTATSDALAVGPHVSLLYGAPALAFALHGATGPGRYERALAALDTQVADLVRQRLDQAHRRIDRGQRPVLAEFDLFKGLTGFGAHLLRRDPHGRLLAEVLDYLVRMTHPIDASGLPGWWTSEPPTGHRRAGGQGGQGGHGNLSMAHGISGPLALLALAASRGIVVDGQPDAIRRICAWTDAWRQTHPAGPWWPEVITVPEVHVGRPRQTEPGRPSWCYGTPGYARAQQLAGLALGDRPRQHLAEHALHGCLTDPIQLALITDPGLCHGWAGVLHTSRRIAESANNAALTSRVNALTNEATPLPHIHEPGFLNGMAGFALALLSLASLTSGRTVTNWDSCLLLTTPTGQEMNT
ncbi:lanthionine synthetase C family protein [Nonomuraea endophytica]|uniref:lanthionine synthetase C family protein n=1 Tax=Nonomuraea endophytica TaxID=714136 RepID=UPI0037C9A22A